MVLWIHKFVIIYLIIICRPTRNYMFPFWEIPVHQLPHLNNKSILKVPTPTVQIIKVWNKKIKNPNRHLPALMWARWACSCWLLAPKNVKRNADKIRNRAKYSHLDVQADGKASRFHINSCDCFTTISSSKSCMAKILPTSAKAGKRGKKPSCTLADGVEFCALVVCVPASCYHRFLGEFFSVPCASMSWLICRHIQLVASSNCTFFLRLFVVSLTELAGIICGSFNNTSFARIQNRRVFICSGR